MADDASGKHRGKEAAGDSGERQPVQPISQAPPLGTPLRGMGYGATVRRTQRSDEEVLGLDEARLSFSQAQGYEETPGPLRLEELPRETRTQIWNQIFSHLKESTRIDEFDYGSYVGGDWSDILQATHVKFHNSTLDEWTTEFETNRSKLREFVESRPFNKVFDLIQFVLRHPRCPRGFIRDMKRTFAECRLAYTIDFGPPPTIIPAVTPEEGDAVVGALRTLRDAGLNGSAVHLRKAAACINAGDWAGSVRESIHAVESVARQLDPEASATLGPALSSLEKQGKLHPALKDAFSKLYGYTSDEQGIRHALLYRANAQVGQDEAVFMLGACASFASYLWRRHAAGASA